MTIRKRGLFLMHCHWPKNYWLIKVMIATGSTKPYWQKEFRGALLIAETAKFNMNKIWRYTSNAIKSKTCLEKSKTGGVL